MKVEYSIEELEKEIRNSKDVKYGRRVQAIKLRMQGYKVKEILRNKKSLKKIHEQIDLMRV